MRGFQHGSQTIGTSGLALTPDEAKAETLKSVAWSLPSKGITGDLGEPTNYPASGG